MKGSQRQKVEDTEDTEKTKETAQMERKRLKGMIPRS